MDTYTSYIPNTTRKFMHAAEDNIKTFSCKINVLVTMHHEKISNNWGTTHKSLFAVPFHPVKGVYKLEKVLPIL